MRACSKYRAWSNGFIAGWLFTLAIIVGPFLFMSCGGPKQEVVFPSPRPGYVHDFAGVLRPNVVKLVNDQLRAADKAGVTKMAVVTVPTLQGLDVADFTIQLGKKWGVGEKKSDNGVILLIAVKERKIRIEVGYGSEGKLTDAASHQIIRHTIAPFLKNSKDDYNGGIQAGVTAILAELGQRG
jgi:uncharacterized protein